MTKTESFCNLLKANVDNEKLTDENFRQLVRNSIDTVLEPEESNEISNKPFGV